MIKLKDAAKKLGVHKQTAWKYIKEDKIKAIRASNGMYYITQDEIDKFIGENNYEEEKGVAIYARVSSSQNKDDLTRQVERLVQFANAKGWRVIRIEKEIASGVNDQRPKLLSLLKDYYKYQYIIVEHKDRLTRFGFNLIINNINNIYVVNEVDDKDHEIIEDLTAIITSFCARIYGLRRSKRKTETILNELYKND